MTFIVYYLRSKLLLYSFKDDNKLPRGYYAFATTWNSFLKTSGLIKCQSDIFRIVWNRSTSLCISGSNSKRRASDRVRYICFCIFQIIIHLFISHACHISRCFPILSSRWTLLLILSLTRRTLNLETSYNGLPVTASRCLRKQIFFLCNAQAVHTIHGHMTTHSHGNETKSRAR